MNDEVFAAKRTVARNECSLHGHSFDIEVRMGSGDPVRLWCNQEGVGCGAGPWTVSSTPMLLFAGQDYDNPVGGGADDLVGTFATADAAEAALPTEQLDWAHMLDANTGQVIRKWLRASHAAEPMRWGPDDRPARD